MGAWRSCLLTVSVVLTLGAPPALGQVTVTVGTLPAGKSVTVTFDAQINNPLPPGTTQISQQGTLTGDTFSPVLSDDPTTAAAPDPTLTRLGEALGGGGPIFPTPVPPAEIPTLSQWGALLLAIVLLLVGGRRLYAQSRTQRWLWIVVMLGLLGTTLVVAQQSIPTVTLTDQLLSDQNGNGRIDAGDLLRYRARITNPGPTDLMNVVFTLTLDPNTTLVSGSLNTSPLALDQTVFVTLNTPQAVTLTGSDAEGDPLTFTITDDPGDGSLSGTPPNLIYTPDAGFTGTDTLRFRTNDGKANSNEEGVITFTVTTNAPPTATAQNVSTPEDTDLPLTLTGTDPESQPLTFAIATNPSHGSLSGTPPTVTYSPALNYNGPDSFTFTAHDGSTTSAPATVTITVTPVNDAPLAAPANVTTNEGSPVDILLVGSDVDNDPLTFSIVTNPTNGGLSGTPPNVTYTPNANFTGDDSFSFKVNDGTVDSNTALVSITVAAVNDPPVLTAGNTLAYTENDPATIIDPTVTVSDVDSANLTSATVQLTGNYQNGQDVLGFVDTATITGTFDAATGTLTLTGTDTLANYEAALRTVTYQNTSDNPNTANRTVTWIGNDGATNSAGVTSTVTVAAVNDGPLLTAGGTLTYTENQAATAIDPALTVIDPDNTTLTGATVQITTNYQNGQDVLGFTDTPPITGSFNAATGTLTLSGSDTVANYQTALRSVTYQNTSNAPILADRTVSWTTTDGTTASNTATSTIQLTATNDAPVLTAGGTLNYSENAPATAIDATITVSDADSVNLASATVQITGNYQNGQDVLGFVNTPTITGNFTAATGTLTLTGTDTLSNYEAALRSVTYQNTSDTPSTLTRTVTWSGNDGTSDSLPVTSTINVTAVNDAPVNTVPGAQATSNTVALTFSTANSNTLSSSDVDAGGADVQLTLSVPAGKGTLTLATTVGLVFTTGDGTNDETITATGTLTAINTALDGLVYTPPVPAISEVVPLTFTVNDQGNTGAPGAQSDTDIVNISVDGAPTVTTATPGSSATQVALTTNIVLTFSENVNIASSAVTVNCGGAVAFTTTPVLPATNTGTLTIDPNTNLPEGTLCTLTVDSTTVTDIDSIDPPNELDGNADNDGTDGDVDNYVLSFTTDDAPTVTSTTPVNGTTGVALNTDITVNFSESVNATTASVTLDCGGGALAYALSGTPAAAFTLNPNADLPAGATCTVTITSTQVTDADAGDPPNDLDGNNNNDGTDGDVDNFVFTFQTDTAPTVTTRTPAPSAVVATTATLTIGFSENVNLTASAVTLNCGSAISLSGLPVSNTNSVTLTPSSLPAGSSCTVTVVAAEVSDSDTVDPPDTMTANDTWTFSVDAAPTVLNTSPAGGTTNQDPTGTITINFSEAVAFDTTANAANASFDLECPSGTPANFTVTTASPATSVVLNPLDSAIAGQSCVLTVRAAGIVDSDSIDPPNNLGADVTATIGFRSLANDDSYNVTPHLTLSATSGTQGEVDANDFLGTGAITGFGPTGTCAAQAPNGTNFVTTGGGGRVVLNLDGSFGYIPPAGASNTIDSFCYTVTGGDTAAVTFNIANTELVWFVDAAYGGANGTSNGTQGRPFTTLAGATTSDTINDTIFVEFNASAYTCGISLLDGELLIGKGSGSNLGTLSGITPVSGSAFPALGGSNPTLTAAADCVTVGMSNTIRGLSFGNVGAANTVLSGTNFGTLTVNEADINTNGRALNLSTGTFNATFTGITSTGGTNNINLNTVAGTSTLGGGALSGATGNAFNVDTGTGAFTYAGSITNTAAARLVNIINKTAGSVTLSGNLSGTSNSTGLNVQNNTTNGTISFTGTSKVLTTGANPGATLDNNDNATITFSGGGLAITTTSGIGFNALSGATAINVTGAGNTIASTSATALSVANSTIGGSGLNFQSISSGNNTAAADPANGIVLNTTGALGGLTVNGTGTTDGSGGTIQNITTRGASFTSARDITLKNMNFTNAATTDSGVNCANLSLGGNSNLGCNAPIHLDTVTNATLTNLNISGSVQQGINGRSVTNFVLSDTVVTGIGTAADEDGIHFLNMLGTSSITNTSVTGSFDDNFIMQNLSGTLNLTIAGSTFSTSTQGSGILFGIRGTANSTITISGATQSTNNFSGGIVADTFDTSTMSLTVSGSTSSGNNDQLSVSAGDNSNVDLNANNNTLSSLNVGDFVVVSLLGSAFDLGYVFDARIQNNTITVGNDRTADGIFAFNAGGGAMNVAITGNTLNYGGTQSAMTISGGQDGSGAMNFTVTGNTIDMQLDGTLNATVGLLANVAVTGPGNTTSLCADIGGSTAALRNTFTHSLGGNMAAGDVRVRQRNDGTMRLPGYGGLATDTAAVVTYLAGRNTLVNSPTATATAFSTGFAGGGACTQPSP